MAISRSWLLTIPAASLEEDWKPDLNAKIRYVCGQLERGEENGYRHYQVYVELTSPQRMSWIKKWIGTDSIHCEQRKGTRMQAREYCMKAETRIGIPFELGEWERGGQGARADLLGVYDMLKEDTPLLTILDTKPIEFMKFHRGIREAQFLIQAKAAQRFRKVKTTCLIGAAGTGKTRVVYDLHGFDNVFKLDHSDPLWFDGYNGEDVLLIDDFYGWIKWGMFLNILDGYPLRIPVKGSFTWANWTKVFITSNKEVPTWYVRGCPPELKRRITAILKFVTM